MLELARRIPLAGNVGKFLEFEAPLHGRGVICALADEIYASRPAEPLRPAADAPEAGKKDAAIIRQPLERRIFFVDVSPPRPRRPQGKRIQDGQLCLIALGRGDGDLPPGARHERAIAHGRKGGIRRVRDA